jgi:hypothetical protein
MKKSPLIGIVVLLALSLTGVALAHGLHRHSASPAKLPRRAHPGHAALPAANRPTPVVESESADPAEETGDTQESQADQSQAAENDQGDDSQADTEVDGQENDDQQTAADEDGSAESEDSQVDSSAGAADNQQGDQGSDGDNGGSQDE